MRTNEFVGIIARGTSGRLMAGVEFTLSFTPLCRKPPLNVGIADGDSTEAGLQMASAGRIFNL